MIVNNYGGPQEEQPRNPLTGAEYMTSIDADIFNNLIELCKLSRPNKVSPKSQIDVFLKPLTLLFEAKATIYERAKMKEKGEQARKIVQELETAFSSLAETIDAEKLKNFVVKVKETVLSGIDIPENWKKLLEG